MLSSGIDSKDPDDTEEVEKELKNSSGKSYRVWVWIVNLLWLLIIPALGRFFIMYGPNKLEEVLFGLLSAGIFSLVVIAFLDGQWMVRSVCCLACKKPKTKEEKRARPRRNRKSSTTLLIADIVRNVEFGKKAFEHFKERQSISSRKEHPQENEFDRIRSGTFYIKQFDEEDPSQEKKPDLKQPTQLPEEKPSKTKIDHNIPELSNLKSLIKGDQFIDEHVLKHSISLPEDLPVETRDRGRSGTMYIKTDKEKGQTPKATLLSLEQALSLSPLQGEQNQGVQRELSSSIYQEMDSKLDSFASLVGQLITEGDRVEDDLNDKIKKVKEARSDLLPLKTKFADEAERLIPLVQGLSKADEACTFLQSRLRDAEDWSKSQNREQIIKQKQETLKIKKANQELLREKITKTEDQKTKKSMEKQLKTLTAEIEALEEELKGLEKSKDHQF